MHHIQPEVKALAYKHAITDHGTEHALTCTYVMPPTLQIDFLGESTEGDLHLVDSLRRAGVVNVFGMKALEDIYTIPVDKLRRSTQVRACACTVQLQLLRGV